MSNSAIKVENVSKQYRLGEREGYKTFREAIAKLSKAPFRRWNGSKPSSLNSDPDSETIWALKDVSFEVKQGEVVGIIGRNGAGKSTLLKVLSKITEPTSGRVQLKGRVGSLLEVGTGFHPELTGHENIYLYGAILGMNRWEVTRKFDEIVAFAEIEKFINTPVKRYSSGMYTRLAFAVAAHLEPEILLVDEVLAVGDIAFQKKCLGKMEKVSGEGRTVLFVSHNMAAIQGLCDRAILLENGGMVLNAETSKVIEAYSLVDDVDTEAKISLKSHANRAPGCKAVLEELQIMVNGELSTNIGMGQPLEISVSFKSPKPVRGVGISFEDSLGRRLFIVSPNYTNPDLLGSSTTCGKLICTLPNLPLLPNTYYLTVSAAGFTDANLDKIERVAALNVSERDVFKTGVRLGPDKGILFALSNWRLDS
jgi:lipopolysaccharide transport system ATP-binding protein